MSIKETKEQIAEIDLDLHAEGVHIGGMFIKADALKALADSHTKLYEAAQVLLVDQDGHFECFPSLYESHAAFLAAIEEAEQ